MTIAEKLDFEIIGDINSADKCMIFIHGWSGNKSSFKKISSSFGIKSGVWILPQAPYKIDDRNGGFSWTYESSPGKYERREPVELLLNFFNKEIFSRFNSKDVYLLGFSQGALVCFELIRILDKSLGGIFPISGFMGDTKKDIKRIHKAQRMTPILIGHGEKDSVILKSESELAYQLLSKESDRVSLEIYEGGHKIGFSYVKKVKNIIEGKYK